MDYNTWELIAKKLSGELDESELLQFEDWLSNSSANQILFQKAEEVWTNRSCYDHLNDEEFLKHIGSDSAKVWSGIEESIEETPSHSSPIRWAIRIAASIVLIIGLGWLWKNNQLQPADGTSYAVQVHSMGETQQVQLPDGSMVWLNENATLSYPEEFASETRTVKLQGEAYFDIERDESKPFLIMTSQSTVGVLGTSFNLDAGSVHALTTVTVTSGKVSLAANASSDQEVTLIKGDVGVWNPNTKSLTKTINDDLNFLAWKTGILTFENQKLADVAQTLASHYKVSVECNSLQIKNYPLTASFDNQSIDEVLTIIAKVHDLNVSKDEKGYQLN